MKKFNYTYYQEQQQSFGYEVDLFNPINNPPEKSEKKEYIRNYIVPIIQEYCRDFLAVLEIEEKTNSITINMITDAFIIIKEETDFKAIIYYSTSFAVEKVGDKIKLELYFSTI